MAINKLLICGANGQLGYELRSVLARSEAAISKPDSAWNGCEVVGADIQGPDVEILDVVNPRATREFIVRGGFDAVINCVAATDVDGCESNPDMARALNCDAARNIAQTCEESGAKLVHISTDYVLAGDDPEPQDESAIPAPNTVYGRTKLEGERAVLDACSRSFVVRTAWLYGTRGKSFIRTMVRLGGERESVTVVNDQHGSPTFAEDLACHLLELAKTDNYGLYHCTGNGSTTWDEVTRYIYEKLGITCNVVGCSTEEWGAPALRPAWSILDNKRLRETIGDNMRTWDVALEDFLSRGVV